MEFMKPVEDNALKKIPTYAVKGRNAGMEMMMMAAVLMTRLGIEEIHKMSSKAITLVNKMGLKKLSVAVFTLFWENPRLSKLGIMLHPTTWTARNPLGKIISG
jgi:hypothetical protein